MRSQTDSTESSTKFHFLGTAGCPFWAFLPHSADSAPWPPSPTSSTRRSMLVYVSYYSWAGREQAMDAGKKILSEREMISDTTFDHMF